MEILDVNDLIEFDDGKEWYEEDGATVKYKTDEQEEHVNRAWQAYAQDIYDEVTRLGKLPGVYQSEALCWFLRALYTGSHYPEFCSHAFHGLHKVGSSSGNKVSILKGMRLVGNNGTPPNGMRFITSDRPNTKMLLTSLLPSRGSRSCGDFPSDLAKDLINKYCPAGGSVLDPCHGWGGRLVGFYLSDARSYTGVDVSKEINQGVQRIRDLFSPYVPEHEAELIVSPFEDVRLGKRYDFALTSPPYFTRELYPGGGQPHEKYSTYEDWRDGFYLRLMVKVFAALNPKGYFCLQVGSQKYPLLDDGRDIAKEIGFEVVEEGTAGRSHHFAGTSDERGECVLTLRKPPLQ